MTRSLMRYHPRLGYSYVPAMKLRVQGASGGYLVQTNAAGFRSDREFENACTPNRFRALLFGDSQTAGDGTANAHRYSDLLEAAVPGLQIYNHAISGSATDQQYLTYLESRQTQHDLVIVGLYVENIRRVTSRVVRARDTTGREIFRAKPYYKLEGDSLTLHHVPVPKQPWTEETLPEQLRPYIYSYADANFFFRRPSRWHETIARALTPFGPLRRGLKWAATRFKKFQPLPDYDRPDTPGWTLLRSLLKRWADGSRVPILLVLLPHESALSGLSDARRCQARFAELALEDNLQVFDPLPALRAMRVERRQQLWSDSSGHLSNEGHAEIARLLVPVLRSLMDELASTGRAMREDPVAPAADRSSG